MSTVTSYSDISTNFQALYLSTVCLEATMEKLSINMSTKNIGFTCWNTYEKYMIDSYEDLIQTMRWKLFHFKLKKRKKQFAPCLSDDQETNSSEQFYGLRTLAEADVDLDLKSFQDDMIHLFSCLKQRNFKSSFQDKLREIENRIKSTDKFIIGSDKTGNFYLLPVEDYKRKLHENITKDYRKVSDTIFENVDKENAKIARELTVEWRLEKSTKQMAFLTIKDHKADFPGKVSCRLINPMKTPLGRISKKLLERINSDVRRNTNLNQWQFTRSALDWFQVIDNKQNKKFFQFDIEGFYPNITEESLKRALQWARGYSYISDKAVEIILQARKTFYMMVKTCG